MVFVQPICKRFFFYQFWQVFPPNSSLFLLFIAGSQQYFPANCHFSVFFSKTRFSTNLHQLLCEFLSLFLVCYLVFSCCLAIFRYFYIFFQLFVNCYLHCIFSLFSFLHIFIICQNLLFWQHLYFCKINSRFWHKNYFPDTTLRGLQLNFGRESERKN